jgi:hypothetical protein
MRKFIVDFGGEEAYELEDDASLFKPGHNPQVLYMITSEDSGFIDRALGFMGDLCEIPPHVWVKYRRVESDNSRFGIGFTPATVREPGVIKCLNDTGIVHFNKPYHFVIYYDDRDVGVFSDDLVKAEFPKNLGRSHRTAARSELKFFEIEGF